MMITPPRLAILLLGIFLVAVALLLGCHPGSNPGQQKNRVEKVAWDTFKIKAAVNDYLKTHEKYYTLIDSISYWMDTLSTRRIMYDQSNYYVAVAVSLPYEIEDSVAHTHRINHKKNPEVTRYYDLANDYTNRANGNMKTDFKGFRVFVQYRLSDVMLTSSDFTPYLFYLDTAYHMMLKRNFLHYTDVLLKPPSGSGTYLDTPYLYTPLKE